MQTMKRKIIIKATIAVVIITGMWKCHRVMFYNKNNHLYTDYIGNGIYEERFRPFSGGVLMSDTKSYYLTDSSKFRILLGQCEDYELYRCQSTGDKIVAVKYSRIIYYGRETPIDTLHFSISKLKEEGDFD